MPEAASTHEDQYLSAFDAFEKNGAARDPAWLRTLRGAAITRFAELGFPMARRGNEEWKYTDIRPIAQTPFLHLPAPQRRGLSDQDLERINFWASRWSQLVFINGRYSAKSTAVSALPAGIIVTNLAQATTAQRALVEEQVAHHADYQANAFTALNTAFLHDGAFVYIPDGAVVEQPVHLLFVAASQEEFAAHPRLLVVAGAESKVTVIETHIGLTGARYFTNTVTEIVVGEGASVEHCKLQRESPSAFHVGTTQVAQQRDSTFGSLSLDLGGGLVRNNLRALLDGRGSRCTLNGLYLPTGGQHVDNQTFIDHAQPHATSRELYKGVVSGSSTAVFNGRVLVRPDAQGSDAQQTNKTLVLSGRAKVNSKPQLEIYADDVKCTHGSAVGQLEEEGLFYLKSRGIGDDAARTLLAHGFVAEVLGAIGEWHVHAHAEELVAAKLHEHFAGRGTP